MQGVDVDVTGDSRDLHAEGHPDADPGGTRWQAAARASIGSFQKGNKQGSPIRSPSGRPLD